MKKANPTTRKEMVNTGKAILVSIRPEWCAKIARGEKTIEVRKTRPLLNTPFKCYVYCTKAHYSDKSANNEAQLPADFYGKIIGEFICDYVVRDSLLDQDTTFYACACLTKADVLAYCPNGFLFGWHISDLKIYNKPKKLTEFCRPHIAKCALAKKCSDESQSITRLICPPQSWCYVDELMDGKEYRKQ